MNETSLYFVFAFYTNPAFVGIRHEAAGFGKARDGVWLRMVKLFVTL